MDKIIVYQLHNKTNYLIFEKKTKNASRMYANQQIVAKTSS